MSWGIYLDSFAGAEDIGVIRDYSHTNRICASRGRGNEINFRYRLDIRPAPGITGTTAGSAEYIYTLRPTGLSIVQDIKSVSK